MTLWKVISRVIISAKSIRKICARAIIFSSQMVIWTQKVWVDDLGGRELSKRLLKRSLHLAARGRKLLSTLLKDFRSFSQASGSTQEAAAFRRAFS